MQEVSERLHHTCPPLPKIIFSIPILCLKNQEASLQRKGIEKDEHFSMIPREEKLSFLLHYLSQTKNMRSVQ